MIFLFFFFLTYLPQLPHGRGANLITWRGEKNLCKESIFFTNVNLFLWDHLDLYDCVFLCTAECVSLIWLKCGEELICGACHNAATQHVYKGTLLPLSSELRWMDLNKISLVILANQSVGQDDCDHLEIIWCLTRLIFQACSFVILQKSVAKRKQVDCFTQVTVTVPLQPCRLKTGAFLWNGCRGRGYLTDWLQWQAIVKPINTFSKKWSEILAICWNCCTQRVFGMFENTSTSVGKTGLLNYFCL